MKKNSKRYQVENLPLQRAQKRLAIEQGFLGDSSPVIILTPDVMRHVFDSLFVQDGESPRYSQYELNGASEDEIGKIIQYARREFVLAEMCRYNQQHHVPMTEVKLATLKSTIEKEERKTQGGFDEDTFIDKALVEINPAPVRDSYAQLESSDDEMGM